MKQEKQILNKDVKIKISSCNVCKNIVRVAVEHKMTDKSKKEFAAEVFEGNLNVTTQPLNEYMETKYKWCDCK